MSPCAQACDPNGLQSLVSHEGLLSLSGDGTDENCNIDQEDWATHGTCALFGPCDTCLGNQSAKIFQYHDTLISLAFLLVFVLVVAISAVAVLARGMHVKCREVLCRYLFMGLSPKEEPVLFKRVLKHFFVPMHAIGGIAGGCLVIYYIQTDSAVCDGAVTELFYEDAACWAIMQMGTIALAAFSGDSIYVYLLVVMLILIQCCFVLMILRYLQDPRPRELERTSSVLRELFLRNNICQRCLHTWIVKAAPTPASFFKQYEMSFHEFSLHGHGWADKFVGGNPRMGERTNRKYFHGLPNVNGALKPPPWWVKVLRYLLFTGLSFPPMLITSMPIILYTMSNNYTFLSGLFSSSVLVGSFLVLLREFVIVPLVALMVNTYLSFTTAHFYTRVEYARLYIEIAYSANMFGFIVFPVFMVVVLDGSCWGYHLAFLSSDTVSQLYDWDLYSTGASSYQSKRCVRALFGLLGPIWVLLVGYYGFAQPLWKLLSIQPWLIKCKERIARCGRSPNVPVGWASRADKMKYEHMINEDFDPIANEAIRITQSTVALCTMCSLTAIVGAFEPWVALIMAIGLYFSLMAEIMITSEEGIDLAASAHVGAVRASRYWALTFASKCISMLVHPPMIPIAFEVLGIGVPFHLFIMADLDFPGAAYALYALWLLCCIAGAAWLKYQPTAAVEIEESEVKRVGNFDQNQTSDARLSEIPMSDLDLTIKFADGEQDFVVDLNPVSQVALGLGLEGRNEPEKLDSPPDDSGLKSSSKTFENAARERVDSLFLSEETIKFDEYDPESSSIAGLKLHDATAWPSKSTEPVPGTELEEAAFSDSETTLAAMPQHRRRSRNRRAQSPPRTEISSTQASEVSSATTTGPSEWLGQSTTSKSKPKKAGGRKNSSRRSKWSSDHKSSRPDLRALRESDVPVSLDAREDLEAVTVDLKRPVTPRGGIRHV